jgi:probable rRNA maturation factor
MFFSDNRLKVEVQSASDAPELPSAAQIQAWAQAAAPGLDAELVVRIVDRVEGTELNRAYRGRNGPTNVLSFPFEPPAQVRCALLGDVVICAPVVIEEARGQCKDLQAHWAHLVIHGVLHLRGFDHQDPAQALEMEALEVRALARLGFPDPYAMG